MPLQSFSQGLQSAGSAYDQKLDSLVGIGTAIKQGQVVQQRIVQEIAAQKELIQFKSDVQSAAQLEFYNEVTKPQEEAKQQQDLSQAWIDAQKLAQETITAKKRDFFERFPNANSLGMAMTDFVPNINEQTGIIEIQHVLNGQEVSIDEYETQLQDYEDFGQWVNRIEKEAGELETLTQEDREQIDPQFNVVDANNVNQIVSSIRGNNVFEKERWFQRWKDRGVKTTKELSFQREDDPDDFPAEFRDIGASHVNLMSTLNTDRTFQLTAETGGFLGIGENVGDLSLNFDPQAPDRDSILNAKRKIETFVEVLDINPLALDSSEGRGEIMSAVEDQVSPTVIRDMFTIYDNLKTIGDTYARVVLPEGKTIDLNKTFINPNFIFSPNTNPRDILIQAPITEQEFLQTHKNLR